MIPLRCLIVDDERLARESLRGLLAELPGVEVVGEADRPAQAIAAVKALRPDVLLLDVQMPGGGGFEVLRALESPPPVVFVTAYDQYAIRAFEVNAVDYLLKPVEPARLKLALERARQRSTRPEAPSRRLGEEDVVLLELGASGHFRAVQDILAVQADGKYSRVACADGRNYLIRRSMKEWQRCLPRDSFMLLERGLLINRRQVAGADFQTRTATLYVGRCRLAFELGRSAATRLRRLLA